MAINTSRLRVLRSLTGDSENGPYTTLKEEDDDDTLMGASLKDRLTSAGTEPAYPDPAEVGRDIKTELGHKTSEPGADPLLLTPEYLEAAGYSTTINGSEEQRLIDKMVLSGAMSPGEGMARKSGTWSQASADAEGNINALLYHNAQLRKNENAATDFWDNAVDTVLPQFGAELLTGNDYQSYQQDLQAFTNTLAGSSQAQGRPGSTEAGAALRQSQFGVGVNDSPEEIATAQGSREHALATLFPSVTPYYKPEQVLEGMKMLDRGAKPEVVSAYLESEGIFGQYFDRWWPKTGKYATVRPPSGFAGTMEQQGYTDAGVDKWGRPVSVKVVGQ